MRYLRKTTPEMTAPIREFLQELLAGPLAAHAGDVLRAAIEELVPRVRYGTIEWVTSMLVDEAKSARGNGWDALADYLFRASDMLYDVLTRLDEN
jgi:hypothetical protein